MTNPLVNAVLAVLYIAFVVIIMSQGPALFGPTDTILIPIALLSLFVFSVLIMGYLFLLYPVTLYLDGKKEEALRFLGQAILSFAFVIVLFFGFAYAWHSAYPERSMPEEPDKGFVG